MSPNEAKEPKREDKIENRKVAGALSKREIVADNLKQLKTARQNDSSSENDWSDLFKTRSSMKLHLYVDEKETDPLMPASLCETSSIKMSDDVRNILNRNEIPLNRLHCSEDTETSGKHTRLMSTPHPSARKRAEFWSLSNASDITGNTSSLQ